MILHRDGLNGDIHQILFPINHGILCFTGFDGLPPFIAHGPAHADEDQCKACLNAYRQRLSILDVLEPIHYPSIHAYAP